MVLSDFNGSVTTTSVEQNLFDVSALKHYSSWVNLHNLQSADSVQIRVYIRDPNASTTRKYLDVLVAGSQTTPAFYIPWVPSQQYRVTIQRIGGVDRTITWSRQEQ